MARLVLLVHAETAATQRAAFPADEPLSDAGRARLARLHGEVPAASRAWCSPAAASLETAAALGYQASPDAGLADLDCGRWLGREIAAVGAAEAAAVAAWFADPTFAGHGGESLAALLARVAGWLARRLDVRGTVLAVTHGAVARCAVLAVLGTPADGFWRLDAGPLTRVELSSDGRRWTLRQIIRPD